MAHENDDDTRLNRRDVLKLGAISAIGLVGLSPESAIAGPAIEREGPLWGPGHVVRVHMPNMRGRFFPHAAAAKEMVERAISAIAGVADVKKAWGRFITKDDRVGIKINVLGGRFAGTMREVVEPIVDGVRAVGVPDENIMIYDQYDGYMRAARYAWQAQPGKLRVINHEVLGYEKALTDSGGGGIGRLAKTLTWTTAVINVPVIKDHDLAGVTCAMKNMVCGNVERPPLMHQHIHTALAHFYALEAIRGRVRLTICDGSFCMYEGGPQYNPGSLVSHDCVYATTDPVAMDAIALEVIDGLRVENKLRRLEKSGRPATFLKVAEDLGLGIASRDRIHLETIELPPFVAPDGADARR
jgi:uncharacterized protein (DUF362 family)